MKKRKTNKKLDFCSYHLCEFNKKRTTVYVCPLPKPHNCENKYCKKHRRPKFTMTPSILFRGKLNPGEMYQLEKIWRDENAHPCAGFNEFTKEMENEQFEKMKQALDNLRKIEPTPYESEYEHEGGVPIRIPKQRLLTSGAFVLLVLILLGLFIVYKNPELIQKISSFKNLILNLTQSISQSTSKSISQLPEKTKSTPPTTIIITKPNIDTLQLERDIHTIVNEKRLEYGLSQILFDEKLTKIARSHSEDMINRNYFSHDSPDGCDPTCRYLKNNYYCHIELGGGYYVEGGAENIFQNTLYDSVTYINLIPIYDWNSQEEISSSTVEGWMSSTGHRENILTSYWRNEGIGVAISSDDKVYITQNFC